MNSSYDAVLILSFGGPEKKEDIMPFLEIVTQGRGIPRERLIEVSHHYEAIGGSPINEITRRQTEGLRSLLSSGEARWPVYLGQRNWHPFLEDTLRKMAADGIRRAIGFATAAHRCEASLERYVNAVAKARAAIGPSAPEIDFVNPWFDHPLFVEAIAARVQSVLDKIPLQARQSLRWVFTAHSVPCSMAKESTYVEELRTTAEAVARRVGISSWRLAFSSRSGNPRDPWLEPDVCDLLKCDGAQGVKDLIFIPIGFVADHVEVLYDLDVEAKEAAETAGITLWRSETVGDHPLFLQMIAEVVRERAAADASEEQIDSKGTRYRDGRRGAKVGSRSRTCFCQPESQDPPCCRPPASRPGGHPMSQAGCH